MKSFFCFVFVASFFSGFGQQSKIDSIWTQINKTEIDTIKVNLFEKIAKETYYQNIEEFNKLVDSMFYYSKKAKSEFHLANSYSSRGRYFVRLGKLDSTKFHYYNALKIYKKINKKSDLAIIYGNIGSLFLEINDKDSTQFYLNKAIDINTSINDDTGLFFNYYNLGVLQSRHNDSDKAAKSIIKALEYAEKTKNTQYIAYCHSMLGVLYMELEIYGKAEEYLDKSIKSFKILENFSGIGTQYTNLGVIASKHEKNFVKAIRYHKKALVNHSKVSDNRFITADFSNIGNNFLAIKKLDSAQYYLNKGLYLSDSINFIEEKGRILRILGEIAFELDSIKIAKSYLHQSLLITQENNFLVDYAEAQLVFSQILAKEGYYQEAYNKLIKGSQIKDSINATEKLEKLALIETKYQTEKKEKENLQLKAEKVKSKLEIEKENRQKWFFATLAIVSIFAIVIGVFYTKNRRQKLLYKSQLAIAKAKQQEHQRIATDLHDYKVKTLEEIASELQNEGKEKLAQKVDTIKESIRKLSKEMSQISFLESEFNEQIITLLASYSSEDIQIHQKGVDDIAWKTVDDTIKQNLFLVIREGISNTYNHSEAKNVSLVFQQKGGQLEIIIKDDGKGFEDATPGIGFTNMKMRINEINGKIKIESEKNAGTQIGIYLALV